MPGVLRETADSVTYGRTSSDRRKCGCVVVFFALFALFGLWMAVDPSRFGDNISGNRGAGTLALLVFGVFVIWTAMLTRKQEIELCPSSRSYKVLSGSKTAAGTYGDIAGLVLICRRGRAGPLRWIRLRFRNGLADVALYFSYSDQESRAELVRLGAKFDLPILTSDA